MLRLCKTETKNIFSTYDLQICRYVILGSMKTNCKATTFCLEAIGLAVGFVLLWSSVQRYMPAWADSVFLAIYLVSLVWLIFRDHSVAYKFPSKLQTTLGLLTGLFAGMPFVFVATIIVPAAASLIYLAMLFLLPLLIIGGDKFVIAAAKAVEAFFHPIRCTAMQLTLQRLQDDPIFSVAPKPSVPPPRLTNG